MNYTKNYIFGGASIIALGVFTYLARRYMNTITKTTNQYYIKKNELPQHNILHANDSFNTIYLFWNGDINSTYLLIDLLRQNKLIQPIYIERYTILKALEYAILAKLTQQYKQNKQDTNTIKYLTDVARIKQQQTFEITQLDFLRKIIIKQYDGCHAYFLPTMYITTINKDLEYTSKFFNYLKDIAPIHYNGIEFYEQITRFIKHYKPIGILKNTRIILGYNKSHKNTELITKLYNKLCGGGVLDSWDKIVIDMPLKELDTQTIQYLATEIMENNILQILKQEKTK